MRNKIKIVIDGKEVYTNTVDNGLTEDETYKELTKKLLNHIEENKDFYDKLREYVENGYHFPIGCELQITNEEVKQNDKKILFIDGQPFAEGGIVNLGEHYKLGEDDEEK